MTNAKAMEEKIISELRAGNLNDLRREVARLAALVEVIQLSRMQGEETAPVQDGKAVFSKLKLGMQFFITVDGLAQPMTLIQKQENNILFFDEKVIQNVTVHFF